MTRDEDIISVLRGEAMGKSAVQIADLLATMLEGGLTQSAFITYFRRAFPDIPLRVLLELGGWSRVSDGGLSDDEINSALQPWLSK